MVFGLMEAGLRCGLLRTSGKWMLDCGARLGITTACPGGILSIPPEVQRDIGGDTSVYFRTACTHRSFRAGGGEQVLVAAAGLGF